MPWTIATFWWRGKRALAALKPPAANRTKTALWQETQGLVPREQGVLSLDATTLDKPDARKMALVTRHWSGKHRRVVWGINRVTLLWSDGAAFIPWDFRVYDKPLSGKSKNHHFRELVAQERGFAPY